MPWNALECASECLKLLKFPGGATPRNLRRVKNCRVAMFPDLVYPPDSKSYVWSCTAYLAEHQQQLVVGSLVDWDLDLQTINKITVSHNNIFVHKTKSSE